ncbi:hypothetical protein EIP91_009386 [Steccherinum ochraceum]|uniref:P-loop containing nucleoside triphosphate hydrolase protein n=1 Tax=Steccherinum ochraceum TaxID=92696 RepID=A0A4V2MV28_9APHY|nr:hypothetical protein EIP91_009386 [Steccherinum ochraceum]
MDADDHFVWAKVIILTVAGAVIPLTMPREHIPVDPNDIPKQVPLSDTGSYLTMMTHAYCDTLIYKANKVDHLPYDELPPLSDESYAKNLVKRSYQHLDPLVTKGRRNIVWSLIFRVFRWEFVEVVLMQVVRIFTLFLGPIGINRLLNYLETGGEGAVVKPWVWIVWLLIGPVFVAMGFDWLTYRQTKTTAQTQAILTQLVFDHALRMRVKANAPEVPPPSEPEVAGSSTADNQSSNNGSPAEQPTVSAGSSSSASSATKVQVDVAKSQTKDVKPEQKSSKGAGQDLVGRLNNLVTADLATLQAGQQFPLLFIFVPLQIIASTAVLYAMVGWSVFPGIAVMVAMTPIPGYISQLVRGLQVDKMKKSDSRVQSVTETMNSIRMVKLFGWEPRTSEQIAEKRAAELVTLRKVKLTNLLISVTNQLIPIGTVVVTFSTYTLIMKQPLSASKVFASMAVFELIQEYFTQGFLLLTPIIQAKVSLDRINEFLIDTELLDEFTAEPNSSLPTSTNVESDFIGIRAASFTWAVEDETSSASNQRKFTLCIDEEVAFKRGRINLVVGQTGSGKTSLLMALLGEMHYKPNGPGSAVSLPRAGGVAYHAQESWVLNATIKDNILFGAPYDEERYIAVLHQCGLNPDLALFDAGDQTEVGEKGLTLSGGQKARLTLARAAYSPAEILLLDDVFAALDVHTAKWIVDKCLRGELLRGRTIILVTHNLALAAPVADFVVALSANGRILSQGTLSSALEKDKKLQSELDKDQETLQKYEQTVEELEADKTPEKKPSGQLVVEEEMAVGRVSWSALRLFARNMTGSSTAIPFWVAFTLLLFISKLFAQLDFWILGLWATEYEVRDPMSVSAPYYLGLYTGAVMISFAAYAANYTLWTFGTLRAARIVHTLLVDSVLGSTLRWLDRTPISRVITRCTQDIGSIDRLFPMSTYYVFDIALIIAMKFGAVITISPIFSIPGVVVIIAGGLLGRVYMKAQLPVKRESSKAKAPVLGHFGSAISGLVSIRAYGAQDAFRKESYKRIDHWLRAEITFWNLNRWVSVRSSVIAGMFAAGLATYLVYGSQVNSASTTGFSLTMAVGFSSMILWFVRLLNMAEVEGNSVERIQQYLQIEHEPKPTKDGVPSAYWPASGDLRVEGLSARYSADGPQVLHNLSFRVNSGERIGIVGRTGSGKSSLTLSLLRCIITEGKMYYDGIPTDAINLDALRSNITIIPQVPDLLSGSLRQNLDPFSQCDDAELNDALRAAGLFSLQSDDDLDRITLDSAISGGGSNLSVGQRQIVALARAIVRRSKLLILDEATSAIDYETDNIIQTSLRSKLDKDVTLLTVAHRLQTIMDSDRIMVLDAGHIVEFDKPSELLKNKKGFLTQLVEESADKEKLVAMAYGN